MKPKLKSPKRREEYFAVAYRWTAGGITHVGRSVSTGRDQAHADRRFFHQHRHVLPLDIP